MPKDQTSTVLIVSEVRLYREGLAKVLDDDGRLGVVGVVPDAELTLEKVALLQPQVVLFDVSIRRALSSIQKMIGTIVERFPTVKVVALGLSEVESHVLTLAEAGIAGYVSRDGSLEDLVRTIRNATQERFGCSERVAAALLKRVRQLASSKLPATASLTPREQQVGELLRGGLTNKEISKRLCIEVATVKNHVHNLLDKLGARNRGEAAAMIRGHARIRRPEVGR